MGLILGRSVANGSLFFSGTSGKTSLSSPENRVTIDRSSYSLTANIGQGDFTVEMWIRPDSSGNGRGVQTQTSDTTWVNANIFYDADVAFGQPGHGMSLGGGRVHAGGDDISVNAYTVIGDDDLTDVAWHHVAMTRDISSGVLALYVDGNQDQSVSASLTDDMRFDPDYTPASSCGFNDNEDCELSDSLIVLGVEKANFSSGTGNFRGWLTELRLSDSVRYTGNFSVPTSPFTSDVNTMLLYHFDEGSGTSLTDASGNGNTGTIYRDETNGPDWSGESPF